MVKSGVDKILLLLIIAIALGGFIIFLSASLGTLSRDIGGFENASLKQLFAGLFIGGAFLFFFSKFHYRNLRRYSFFILFFALLLTAAVFIPGLGTSHGGATRWLEFMGVSFQPAEFLKLAFIIYLSAWLSGVKERVRDIKHGLLPFALISAISGLILILQPDIDGLMILLLAGLAVFFAAGAPLKHIASVLLVGIVAAGFLFYSSDYLSKRLNTFINPESADQSREGYQVTQSLIAIGSGGIYGRGFGRSLQKFQYLPEPTGDSIFAVAGEEFGFVGASILVSAFLLLALRGLYVAIRANDTFGRLLAVGIVSLMFVQSSINIASMLGLFPLSGTTLLFVSQGGTALALSLLEAGILLSISRRVTS